MNLMSLFRRRDSAPVARERLQVLLAHERAFVGKSDLLAVLQEEIIAEARKAAGDATFELAWADGSIQSIDNVIDEAAAAVL